MRARNARVVFCSIAADLPEKKFNSLLEEIQVVRLARSELPIFCTSEGGNLDRIVQVVRAGASDFEKWSPGEDSSPVRLLELAGSIPEKKEPPAGKYDGKEFCGILGQSSEIRQIFNFITKVSASSSTILIAGESGTGKELVCRAIHKLSNRGKGPLIPINCGAILEELLESELFGHEKALLPGRQAPGRVGFRWPTRGLFSLMKSVR